MHYIVKASLDTCFFLDQKSSELHFWDSQAPAWLALSQVLYWLIPKVSNYADYNLYGSKTILRSLLFDNFNLFISLVFQVEWSSSRSWAPKERRKKKKYMEACLCDLKRC